MRISIAYFHLLAIAALATIVAIPYVAGTIPRSMRDSGKIVSSAESYLKWRCTFTTVPMNITLRNCPTCQNTNQRAVQRVSESFDWVAMVIPMDQRAIYARNVATKSLEISCHDDGSFCNGSTVGNSSRLFYGVSGTAHSAELAWATRIKLFTIGLASTSASVSSGASSP